MAKEDARAVEGLLVGAAAGALFWTMVAVLAAYA